MRLYVLCLILISSLFSCSQAVLNDFITPSMVPFTKPSDIVRAYSLYPDLNPTTRESEINNPPFKSAAQSLYYFNYADYLLNSIYGLTNDDFFGSNSLAFMLSSLQNNANLRGIGANTVMLQHLPSIYKTSIVDPTKYDAMLTSFNDLYGITNLLKMQCISVAGSIQSTRDSIPSNMPTTSKYNAAMSAYTNVITSINQLSIMTDTSLSLIVLIGNEITYMKDVATSLVNGDIDDNTYNDQQFIHAQNIKLYSHSLYKTLYHFSKTTANQV